MNTLDQVSESLLCAHWTALFKFANLDPFCPVVRPLAKSPTKMGHGPATHSVCGKYEKRVILKIRSVAFHPFLIGHLTLIPLFITVYIVLYIKFCYQDHPSSEETCQSISFLNYVRISNSRNTPSPFRIFIELFVLLQRL